MSNTQIIAQRYAQALYNVDASKDVYEQLCAINQTFEHCPQAFEIFSTPVLSYEEKSAFVAQTFGACTKNVLHFLQLLIKNKRIANLKDIVPEYQRILLDAMGIQVARVVTATPVDDAFLTQFIQSVEEALAIKLEAVHSVEQSIIGGVKIQVGSKVIDDSIGNKLDMAKRELLKRGVAHEITS